MKKIILSVLCLYLLFIPLAVSAQTTYSMQPVGKAVGLGDADASDLFANVIRWILGIVSLAAVVMIIVGGFMWMSSAGNEEKVDKAKKIITTSVAALVIILLSWSIVYFVASTFFDITIR